jgi:asparagine synthase (glutamine-hydrolysing)
MCGISGKIYFDQERLVTRDEMVRMSDTLSHRGPDGDGVWIAGHVGLAHRRLAIIDLSGMASQPMSNEDGSVWITFNGEIYNFRELRAELIAKGHIFRTNSDTEAIIHAYEEYGRYCLDRLRGMFAFAIWDERTQTLFLARDRLGKKPLYYFYGTNRFMFASEIKSILSDPTLPVEPNPVALDHFLALQYIPAPLTAFQGIRKLPAAHWLQLREGRLEMGRYWRLRYAPKRRLTLSDAIAELRHHLAEAVRLRLISDVPLGAFLSGGVDSSAVVAYMAQQTARPIQTFAVGFEDTSFDERPYARLVSTRFNTDHTELIVKAPVIDILPRLIWHYDEPFGDSSAIPSYAIAQLTRQHVTVVLNGDGGDESFAGYDWYIMDRRLRYGEMLPLWLRQRAATAIQKVGPRMRQLRPFRKLAKLAAILAIPPERRFARWPRQFAPDDRLNLYAESYLEVMPPSDPEGLFAEVFAQGDAENSTDAALNTDVQLYLVDDLLVKIDRATMAHSLEARSPFLDHELMEFVATLPPEFKLYGSQKKRLLKAALRGLLPDIILDRPKMGFRVPLARWFRQDLREMTYDILLSARARQRGYFRSEAVAMMLDAHCDGREDHSDYLWDLLVLELWHRAFIDGEAWSIGREPTAAHPM